MEEVFEDRDPEVVTSEEIVGLVVEQIARVSDPLGRIVLGDEISKTLLPAVLDQMMADASEFREAGGTWTQISKTLGVSPQSVQQRLNPVARQRVADDKRRARQQRVVGE